MTKQYELPLGDVPADTLEVDDKEAQEVREQGIVEEALLILARRHRHGAALTSPEETLRYLRLRVAELLYEVFGCIFLDNRHRIIAIEEIFTGTIDGASVHPRVVVQKALGHNAAAVIAYHNHPSGVAEPSQADIRITTRLKEALALVEIRLIEHYIVSAESGTSLAERGLV